MNLFRNSSTLMDRVGLGPDLGLDVVVVLLVSDVLGVVVHSREDG